MDITGYHIFINLLVNYMKTNFVKYRQFISNFALVRTAILFTIFFPHYKKLNFFYPII